MTALSACFIAFFGMFASAFRGCGKFASAFENLGVIADEASGSLVDSTRADRQRAQRALDAAAEAELKLLK
jgi:hypothetical protein